jgi:hypothetical protein
VGEIALAISPTRIQATDIRVAGGEGAAAHLARFDP